MESQVHTSLKCLLVLDILASCIKGKNSRKEEPLNEERREKKKKEEEKRESSAENNWEEKGPVLG